MISFHLILFLLTAVALPEQQVPEIEVYQVERDDKIEIWARNRNIYPVTLTLHIDKQNLSSNKPFPVLDVINAKSSKKLLELAIENPRRAWEYNTSYSFFMGNALSKHDDSHVYRLPYRLGTEQKVSQGYGGDFSHQGAVRYSVDFNMPEGTAVFAARNGLVIHVVQDNNEGGATRDFVELANNITIMHEDGSFADYSHLQRNGARVRVGQQVRAGQLIGYSGATGFVTGPHLHFGVKIVQEDGTFMTIPVKFASRRGAIQLEEGKSYTAY